MHPLPLTLYLGSLISVEEVRSLHLEQAVFSVDTPTIK